MNITFLDEQGNVRLPKTWEEVKKSICCRGDTCEPCSNYILNRCQHPLNPNNQKVHIEKLGIIHNGMYRLVLVDDIQEKLNQI